MAPQESAILETAIVAEDESIYLTERARREQTVLRSDVSWLKRRQSKPGCHLRSKCMPFRVNFPAFLVS
jgi:hypothetical protein